MPAPSILTAAVIFLAVALGTVSLALLVEWIQEWHRGRNVVQRLREFSEEAFGADAQGLVRQAESVGALDRAALTIPRLRAIDILLKRAGTRWTLSSFLILAVGLGTGLGIAMSLFSSSMMIGLLTAPAAALVPYAFFSFLARRRVGRFEEQLADAIDLVGRAMRAGHPLSSGFKMVAEESPHPIREEFLRVFEEQRFGLPMDDSLLGLADRIPLTDVRIFVTAIMIHRQVGGNLAEILDNIAHLVRERFKLRRQLRVITAQGRMAGYVLAALPLVMGLAIYTLNREYMMPLFTSSLGRSLVVGAVMFQLMGFLWIRRILSIDF